MKMLNCSGCTACCHNDEVVLTELDDASQYRTQKVGGRVTLKREKSGDCVYLKRGVGCSIHERRPWMCRNFDCRRYLDISPEAKAERLDHDREKWEAIFSAAERHRS